MISVLLAVLASACNAAASYLQRRGTLAVPDGASALTFARTLLRRPIWLAGILAMIGGFLFQAGALAFGGLSLVEPLLVMELPFTLIIIAVFSRTRFSTRTWLAVLAMSGGLAALLVAAAPGPGTSMPPAYKWWVTLLVVVLAIGALIGAAWLAGGPLRTVLLGTATGFGFAFTAALIKGAAGILRADPIDVLTSWPLYALVASGVLTLMLLQVTLRSGTLVAAQPPLTISDPVASMVMGALLFSESIRAGSWIFLELLGIALIVYGAIEISKTPSFQGIVTPVQE